MSFKSLSLFAKILVANIPLVIGIGLTALQIMKLADAKDERSQKAMQMVELTKHGELEMVKMSEGLRGYLLNTDKVEEFQKKKAADAAFAETAEKLGELAKDNAQIVALNKEMADLDANELDRVENEVGEMAQKKDPNALQFYYNNYIPIRQKQSANYSKLQDLVSEYSAQMLKDVENDRRNEALFAVMLLIGTGFVGFLISTLIIRKTVQNLNQVAVALDKSSATLSGAALDISATSQELSASSIQQAASLEQTVASAEQLSSMVGRNSDNAKRTASTLEDCEKQVSKGFEEVTRISEAMTAITHSNHEIEQQILKNNQDMAEVVKIIQDINAKTKVINDIVFQTKLLSFNASVEAARAGESGKGFAVVAEEVGKLAQTSGNAAQEIANMLSESVKHVEQMVETTTAKVTPLIENGKRQVEEGMEVVKLCQATFEELVGNVKTVATMANDISLASNEQASGISEINKAMGQIDQVTHRNTNSSNTAAKAAQGLSAESEALKGMVTNLVEILQGSKAA